MGALVPESHLSTDSAQANDAIHKNQSGVQSFMSNPSGSLRLIKSSIANAVSEAPAVLPQLAIGAVHELEDHPGRVALKLAEGVAIGTVVTLAAPEILTAVGVGATALGASAEAVGMITAVAKFVPLLVGGAIAADRAIGGLAQNGGKWSHDASVVEHAGSQTSSDVKAAQIDLQNAGASETDRLATTLGALGSGAAVFGIRALAKYGVSSLDNSQKALAVDQPQESSPIEAQSPIAAFQRKVDAAIDQIPTVIKNRNTDDPKEVVGLLSAIAGNADRSDVTYDSKAVIAKFAAAGYEAYKPGDHLDYSTPRGFAQSTASTYLMDLDGGKETVAHESIANAQQDFEKLFPRS